MHASANRRYRAELRRFVELSAITPAFWEPIGHLVVALRNTLDGCLGACHRRLERPGSWLDDPKQELSGRARLDMWAPVTA